MTNLELLEEIRKDFILIKNNDPVINSTLLIFITKFKERMYKLDLPVVGVTFKEKNIPTFEDWIKTFKQVDGKLYQLDNYRTYCIAAMHEQYRLTFEVEP